MDADITIAPVTAADEAEWRRLWAGYCAFYQVDLPEAVTAGTWTRILDPESPVHGLIARGPDGRGIGLCNYVLHENTWSLAPVCYLEDLFTDSAFRGKGIGRAMIQRLQALARAQGWRHVYWHTNEDNKTARALYDKVAGGRDPFVRYVLK